MLIPIEILQTFRDYLAQSGRLSSTIHCYSYDITHFLHWLNQLKKPLWVEGKEEIQQYLDDLRHNHKFSENSLRRKLIAIKIFMSFFCSQQSPPLNSYATDIPLPPRDDSLNDVLTSEDIEKLIKTSKTQPSSYRKHRDPALIALLCFEGLKAHEITQLQWKHLLEHRYHSGKKIFSLAVPGKRQRNIIPCESSRALLQNHKQHSLTPTTPTACSENPIFSSLQGKSPIPTNAPMSRHGLKFLLYELGDIMDISKLNTERLRHYAITYQLATGRSSEDIQKHLGLKRSESIARHIRHQKKKLLTS